VPVRIGATSLLDEGAVAVPTVAVSCAAWSAASTACEQARRIVGGEQEQAGRIAIGA
jgi:glycerol dehydrogenase-like iron-containing ADH family enzyme